VRVVILAWIFKEKWLWIIVLSVVTIIVLPFIIILAILNLDPILRIVAVIFLVVCWGVAGAYKDWTRSKREEEEKMKK
jgi:glucan phosphoethanolaminetransferase (alkaline phosphatase superfamily)